jgi:hypothetical protein
MERIMRGGSRSGAGRKATPIDLVELEKVATMGCTDSDVAGFFNVSVRTIEQRRKNNPEFAEAMNRGWAKCHMSVRRAQMKWMEKSPAMCIWLGKQLLGQRDVTPIELTGAQGKPVKFSLEVIDAILAHKKKA